MNSAYAVNPFYRVALYIGIYIESERLRHADWVALSNGRGGSQPAEYSTLV